MGWDFGVVVEEETEHKIGYFYILDGRSSRTQDQKS